MSIYIDIYILINHCTVKRVPIGFVDQGLEDVLGVSRIFEGGQLDRTFLDELRRGL